MDRNVWRRHELIGHIAMASNWLATSQAHRRITYSLRRLTDASGKHAAISIGLHPSRMRRQRSRDGGSSTLPFDRIRHSSTRHRRRIRPTASRLGNESVCHLYSIRILASSGWYWGCSCFDWHVVIFTYHLAHRAGNAARTTTERIEAPRSGEVHQGL